MGRLGLTHIRALMNYPRVRPILPFRGGIAEVLFNDGVKLRFVIEEVLTFKRDEYVLTVYLEPAHIEISRDIVKNRLSAKLLANRIWRAL